MTPRLFAIAAALAGFAPGTAHAHASDQGFVLLLPTGAYTAAGVGVVLLTVLALFFLPDAVLRRVFAHRPLPVWQAETPRTVTSLLSLAILAACVAIGFAGPRDPLANLMPLAFWTLFWIVAVSLSGVVGDLWRWINPWTGLYRLIGSPRPVLGFPEGWGLWPALIVLVGFTAFLLADIAPDDPARLATFVAGYWLAVMVALFAFGPRVLDQVELGRAILGSYARLAPVRLWPRGGVGGPGWDLLAASPVPGAGAFALALLAVGSFDGVNETFWWLARIGVNPLEFPGRSAVIWPTVIGLVSALALLFAVFAGVVWLGMRLAAVPGLSFAVVFNWLGLSLLPIALVYHMAHFLATSLVSLQYTLAALSDPLARGADYLGIEPFHVTTGFFNRLGTVRLLWLTQAGLVVLGHVWSVLLSHRIALTLCGDNKGAIRLTIPLSVLMVGYTFLGLWLLAAPKGA